jgi:hypothetical protein
MFNAALTASRNSQKRSDIVKRNIFLRLMLLGLCVFCLMGVSKSGPARLSVKVPLEVFKIPEGTFCWDWESNEIDDLGYVEIIEWDKVIEMMDKSTDPRYDYWITLEEFETLLRNNIFLFTRIGLHRDFMPDIWDLDCSVGYGRELQHPNAYTLAKILTDSRQEAAREAFVKAGMRSLKDPKTKAAWEAQRQAFCDRLVRVWEVEEGEWGWTDYQCAKNVDYETALAITISDMLTIMKNTDFTAKVLPDEYSWRIVRVINTYFETFYDHSPFRLQAACFRMGPEATQKLIGYVERGLESLKR